MTKKEILIEIIIFLFVLLFLYAAGIKLIQHKTFVAQIAQSPLLTKYEYPISWIIPGVELLIAIMLVTPRIRVFGLYAAFGLMVIFTIYIVAILTISRDLPCSCGGILSSLGWRSHLVFNLGFVVMGFVAIMLLPKQDRGITKNAW